jgi:stage V sporulation protein B
LALPLSGFIDTFLVVNILSDYLDNATSLYGLYSGTALTIIHLPTSLLYGLSQVIIPLLSGSKNEGEKRDKINVTILATLVLSVVFSAVIFAGSPLIVNVLFSGLKVEEKEIGIKLIKIMSVNVIFHSLLQTANGILIAKGKTLKSLIGSLFGVVVKTVLSVILLYNPKFNIYGVAISSIACYFVACLVNLILSLDIKVKHAVKEDRYRRIYRRE